MEGKGITTVATALLLSLLSAQAARAEDSPARAGAPQSAPAGSPTTGPETDAVANPDLFILVTDEGPVRGRIISNDKDRIVLETVSGERRTYAQSQIRSMFAWGHPPPIEPGKPAEPSVPMETHWYGWQTALVGTVVPVFGGMIVHSAHGQGGAAVGSLVLDSLLPLGLAALYESSAERQCAHSTGIESDMRKEDCYPGLAAIGGLFVGHLVAVAISSAFFSSEPILAKAPPSSNTSSGASARDPAVVQAPAPLPRVQPLGLIADVERRELGFAFRF